MLRWPPFKYLSDMLWRSDTRHSEGLISAIMIGYGITKLLNWYAIPEISGYRVYAVTLIIVGLFTFFLAPVESHIPRMQAAFVRMMAWLVVGVHAIFMSTNEPWWVIPLFAVLIMAEALIYLKLYLLVASVQVKSGVGE